jgi:hypothetical protein
MRRILCFNGLLAVGLVVSGVLLRAEAVTPIDSGFLQPVLIYTNIGQGLSGDQYDPHVDGNFASYTSDSKIRYYDFFLADDAQVPSPAGAVDLLSDVSNGRIVFSRIDVNGRIPVLVYDTGLGTTTEVDVTPAPIRIGSAIGGDTVAFIEQDDLLISELGGLTTQVTDDARTDRMPSVAPSGNLVVYESCAATCEIHQAVKQSGTWVVTALTSNAEPEANPDTDGIVVVYDAVRSGKGSIYWQPVGGGAERSLNLPGQQRNPSVRDGLIAFESIAVGETAADVFVYEIATNRLFRITSTPADELLNNLAAVSSPFDGRFRVVWTEGTVGSFDVRAAAYELPPLDTFSFSGFLAPVDPYPTSNVMKAGAAVAVRFSLDGFRGLDIFTAGYPRSSAITCGSAALESGVEQTVSAGSSTLQYDAATDVYSYIWKTERAWAGTCRQLVIQFSDGTTPQYANFKFK